MKSILTLAAALSAAAVFSTQSYAAPIVPIVPDGDTPVLGNLTGNVVMGSGIGNGSFSGITIGSLELALRAKLRFPKENTFNYDGDRTYNFENDQNPAENSVFNLEFAVNTDVNDTDDTPSATISDYFFLVQYDIDATAGVDYRNIGPAGVSFGFNSTPESGGIEIPLGASNSEIQSILNTYNILQGSQNLGFGSVFPEFSDPDAEGIFDFRLSAFTIGANGGFGDLVGATDISVVVGDVAPIPLPAGLPLLLAGLGGFVVFRRRQRS